MKARRQMQFGKSGLRGSSVRHGLPCYKPKRVIGRGRLSARARAEPGAERAHRRLPFGAQRQLTGFSGCPGAGARRLTFIAFAPAATLPQNAGSPVARRD